MKKLKNYLVTTLAVLVILCIWLVIGYVMDIVFGGVLITCYNDGKISKVGYILALLSKYGIIQNISNSWSFK